MKFGLQPPSTGSSSASPVPGFSPSNFSDRDKNASPAFAMTGHTSVDNNPHSRSDIIPLNFGYKKMRETYRRMPSYRGGVPAGHPCFPEGSAAVFRETTGPVDLNAPDLIYTAEDDEAIDRPHRDRAMSHRIPIITLKH
ncbi:hypothetical protein BDR04DRAFT_252663 [Suillus decipiens]|nr:hypothetical protein BDR04DRAFT_252663 [Suillus decipiens]